MPIAKRSLTEVASLDFKDRLSEFRTWFLILVLIGLMAAAYVGYKTLFDQPGGSEPTQSQSILNLIIPTAHAQSPEPTQGKSGGLSGERKQQVMIGIIGVLALVMLAALLAVFFAKDATRISQAGDILKTVLGFFIGVATSFFG